jgi:exopolyphosphatase/pppGpp-phosphohydrolase
MELGRVDVIVGGLCILVQIMRKLDFEELQVSEKDILDGLILSLL